MVSIGTEGSPPLRSAIAASEVAVSELWFADTVLPYANQARGVRSELTDKTQRK